MCVVLSDPVGDLAGEDKAGLIEWGRAAVLTAASLGGLPAELATD